MATKTTKAKSGNSLAQEIKKLHLAGKTNAEITEKLGCTNKYVCDVTWRVHNKVKPTAKKSGKKTAKKKAVAKKKSPAKKVAKKKVTPAPAAETTA